MASYDMYILKFKIFWLNYEISYYFTKLLIDDNVRIYFLIKKL